MSGALETVGDEKTEAVMKFDLLKDLMSCTGVWTAWTRKSLGFNVQFLNIRIEQLAIEKKSSVSQADMWHPRQEVTPCCDPPTRIVPTEEGTLQAS